jgi:hypothetical protein
MSGLRFTAGPCRHCGRPVVLDPAGTPVHTDLSYKCPDRWGGPVETYAELPRVVGRAPVADRSDVRATTSD